MIKRAEEQSEGKRGTRVSNKTDDARLVRREEEERHVHPARHVRGSLRRFSRMKQGDGISGNRGRM